MLGAVYWETAGVVDGAMCELVPCAGIPVGRMVAKVTWVVGHVGNLPRAINTARVSN